MDITIKKTQHIPIIFLSVLSISILGSCTWTPTVETPIYKGPQGSVSLIIFTDDSRYPDHPVSIQSPTMATILKGIHIQKSSGFLQTLISGIDKPTRVFPEGQVTFFTPHLLETFSQITPEEIVTFTLMPETASGLQAVKCTMFKQGGHLIFTLGDSPGTYPRFSKANRGAGSNPTGFLASTLTFEPAEAQIQTQIGGSSGGRTTINPLVINYDYVTKHVTRALLKEKEVC